MTVSRDTAEDVSPVIAPDAEAIALHFPMFSRSGS
jgi:hypothetical protein